MDKRFRISLIVWALCVILAAIFGCGGPITHVSPSRGSDSTPKVETSPLEHVWSPQRVFDSIPRWDSSAILWDVAPAVEVTTGTVDSIWGVDAGGDTIAIEQAADTTILLHVARKVFDQVTVYRLIGRDSSGVRHDVTVPYSLWVITPGNGSIRLPVRPHQEVGQ